MQECVVALHHVVRGHIQRYDAASLVGQFYRLEIFGHQVEGSSQIYGKSAFGVASADEHHAASAGMLALEQQGIDSVLLLVALEEQAQLVVSDFADEARRHAEDGCTNDGVGSAAAGDIFNAERLEGGPYHIARLHVNMLHAALGQMVGLEQRIVRQYGQNIRQSIANSENRFHNLQRYK